MCAGPNGVQQAVPQPAGVLDAAETQQLQRQPDAVQQAKAKLNAIRNELGKRCAQHMMRHGQTTLPEAADLLCMS